MKSLTEIKKIAKETIALQAEAISELNSSINDTFVKIIDLILNSKGRLIISGVGKSANIANKIVATLNSTGQSAIFLHATDAIHGDLGNIQQEDIVICISKSGNTSEIKTLLPFIKDMGNTIIALSGNMDSFLTRQADYSLDVSVQREACPNNLAPTSSTTAQLVMGDALAITLLACKNFTNKDFARFHPGGSLGKRLNLRLSDMISKNSRPEVAIDTNINDAIIEISKKRLGATAVTNNKKLVGIITDGDLRRMLEKESEFKDLRANDIMSVDVKSMDINTLAYDALRMMENYSINQLLIMDGDNYMGIVHIHELIKEGLV